jgi:hypothetical protein
VPLYQRFLEMSPPEVQASATHLALSRCAQQMATEKPAAPPPLVVVPPPPAPLPPPSPPPWTHDRWGGALMATGVAGLVVGGGFLAASFAARPAGADNWADYNARSATADRRFGVAAVAFASGGALVAAGAARYAWVRHRARAAATLTVVPGGLALGGSF